MGLTPKEWKSFQHYKERRPPWIKLHRTLLDNADFQRLPVASRALAPMLWLIAAEYDDGAITATAEDIAWRLRMSVAEFKSALEPLIEKVFFLYDAIASAALADCERETHPETETQVEKETESQPVAKATRPASSKFEDFWKEYPKRDGDNPRKPAEKKFDALVKTGVDPDSIIAGAKQASTEARSRGNYGTRFIPQAIKWLNDQRFTDYAIAAFDEAQPLDWDAILTSYKKFNHWSRDAGPDLDSPACRAPPEMLAKYGLSLRRMDA